MSSSKEEYEEDEEPSQTSNNASLTCGACISYRRQRDNFEKEKEESNKKFEREKELREEGEKELKRLTDKVSDLERINKLCIDALSEVVEKMFYCKKDEGGASIKGGKKGTKAFNVDR
jgi:pyruvate/2-oxoacid:ferredoxin oxidoreductase beta subunit